jgi:hypothetical protein
VVSKEPTGADTQAPASGMRAVAGVLSRLAWLALLIAVPAVIYFFYVITQFEAIQQRDLRVLAETADAIEDTAMTAAKNLDALLQDNVPARDAKAVYRFPRPRNGSAETTDFVSEFFKRQAALNPATQLASSCLQGKSEDSVVSRFFDDSSLSFVVECRREADTSGPVQKANASSLKESSAIARLDLDSVLERVPSTSTLGLVVVVTGPGEVVAEHTPQPDYQLAPGAESVTTLRIRDIEALEVLGGQGAQPDAEALTSQTAMRRVMIAGVAYELACQPLRLPLRDWVRDPPTDTDSRLSVCGFVAESEIRREALQVAPTLLLVLIVLTALGLLSWPVIKVMSMAATERLRSGEVYFVLLSSLCIVLFVIIAWRDSALYLSLREKSFASLREIAADVERDIRSELQAKQQQLCVYDAELGAFADLLDPSRKADIDHPNLFLPVSERTRGDSFPGFSQPLLPAVYDSFFFMLDSSGSGDGKQVIKGTIFRANTPALDLSGREYFSRIKRGRGWNPDFLEPCPAAQKHAGPARDDGNRHGEHQVFVESARSLTTGEFFTALSMPSRVRLDAARWTRDAPEGESEVGLVAAIIGPMLSFEHAALSPGLELSVVDERGIAVFHADPRRARAERIFRDEGVGERLRSAVNAGVEQCFAGNYRGQPRLLCVRPMRDLPWSIVASLRQEPILSANIEILATAATYALAYVAVLVVLTAGFVFSEAWSTRRITAAKRHTLSPRWVWPHLLSPREYWFWNGVGLLGISAICAMSGVTGSNLPLLLCPLPLAALVLFAVTRRGIRQSVTSPRNAASLFAYGSAAFLLWILVAALPATGIFNAAVDTELPRAVVAEQRSFLRGLEARACSIAEGYDRFAFADAPELSRDAAAQRRIEDPRGIYRLGLFAPGDPQAPLHDTQCAETGSWDRLEDKRWFVGFKQRLADFKPVYNETAMGMRYVGLPEGGDLYDRTDPRRCEQFTRLTVPEAGQCGALLAPAAFGEIPFPGLPAPDLWLVAIALAALLAAFVRYTGGSLFFGALPAGRGRRMTDLLADPLTKPVVAVLSTRAQRQHWLEHSGLPLVDLMRPSASELPDRTRAVLVTGFEDLPAEGPERRSRLRALETLCQPGEAVPIILSFHAPRRPQVKPPGAIGLSTTGGEQPSNAYSSGEDAADVHRLLDRLQCCYIDAAEETSGDTGWFDHCFEVVCNDAERLVLYQVATTGFANPKQKDAVQSLLDRGLLLRDPALGIVDEGFRRYIRDSYSGRDLEAAIAPDGSFDSRRLRWIMVILLAAVIAFLTATQPDVVEVWLQFIVAASAGAAALLKVSSSIFGSVDK